MYYSSIGALAFLVLLITHYDVLKISLKNESNKILISYKLFILSVILYYVTDIFWGTFYSLKLHLISYIDTQLYFASMALSIFFWTRYVFAYLNENTTFTKVLKIIGYTIFLFVILVLFINFFIPIVFEFEKDGTYNTKITRYIILLIQILFFFIVTLYTLVITSKSNGIIKLRYKTIGMFGLAMTIFIILQAIYPFMPFYSMGLMLGTCLLHTFVLESEKEEQRKTLEFLIQKDQVREEELGAARHLAYTDPLTGVKNKSAYLKDVSVLEQRIAEKSIEKFGVTVFDLNGLKRINDTKGHEKGDIYIKNGCRIICQQFKHSPIYRIGGDEFVAILEGIDYQNHEELLENFKSSIKNEISQNGVSISFGFSELQINSDTGYTSIFERADKNMYDCKKSIKENNTL